MNLVHPQYFVAENEMTWINVLANGGKANKDYGIQYIQIAAARYGQSANLSPAVWPRDV